MFKDFFFSLPTLRSFHMFIWSWHWCIWKLQFCKKKKKKKSTIFNKGFLCWSQGAFIWHCVFVLSRGGYIAQWHRSTQVVQHSWDGQSAERRPPHQQTDGRGGGAGKAPGTLQWKVGPENVSQSSFNLISAVWEILFG